MTSFQRVMASLRAEQTDRVAVVPEVFGVTARTAGYTIYEYVTEPEKLAESQLNARRLMGYDMLFSFADLSVEAEAIGCELVYRENNYPVVREPIIKSGDDINGLSVPEPQKDGRMPVVLEAASRLREAAGDECIVAACVMGPLSVAGQLMGIEGLLFQMVDNPDVVEKVLDFTEEVARVYGMALLQAGAHCHIIFDPMASPMVVPSEFFVRYELPRLKRLFSEFKKAGSVISWLSIAGNTKKILPYYREAGVELATVDYKVSVQEAFELLSGVAVNGNIRPFCFVSNTAQQLKELARLCLQEGRSRAYILGSGCEVPVDASLENIKALVESAEEFNATQR